MSKVAAHSASMIHVAYALEKLPNIDAFVYRLFDTCFGMKPKDMIKILEIDRSVDPTFNTVSYLTLK